MHPRFLRSHELLPRDTTRINFEQSVLEFRSQLDSEHYHAIYTGADDGLRKGANEQDFTALMQAVHRKLGHVQESHLLSRSEEWATGVGRLVTLVYDTKFAGGSGTEQFVWHIRDNRALLFEYRLNSNEMITK